MNLRDEAELIERCLRGEAKAWERLFEAHYEPICRFAYQLSADLSIEDAEEIAQETLLAAARHLRRFRGGSALQTWLFRIAVNKTRDFLSRRQAEKRGGGRALLSLNEPGREGEPAAQAADEGPLPSEVVSRREEAALIAEALALLPARCRELIQLRYFGDLSYEELAAALGLHPKTVSSRLSRCLRRLAAAYEKLSGGAAERRRLPSN